MALHIKQQIKDALFYLALTCAFGGLQGVFCIILPMGSPYLLSLGYSKSLLALVLLAGPLIGVLAQPYFGFRSDRSRRAMGKRRPYILLGAVGTIISLLGLAWVKDLTLLIGQQLFELPLDALQPVILVAAAIFFWGVLLFVQPIQAAVRTLIVDTCTTEQQGVANAWVSRVVGVGSIFGYALAYTDMSSWLASKQNIQFKALSVLISIILAITVAICCISIREENPRHAQPVQEADKGFWKQIKEILQSASRLSPHIKAIFRVQLCAWFGWYCFLSFTTTWIGEVFIHTQYQRMHSNGIHAQKGNLERFQKAANRQGSLALLLNSVLNLATTMIAPALMELGGRTLTTSPTPRVTRFFTKYLRTTFARWRAGWMFSQLLFTLCMASTFFIKNIEGAIAMVTVLGISTALSLQVIPYTLVSRSLSRHQQPQDPEDGASDGDTQYEYRPGTVLGLHNVSICAPQLVSSICSSVIFWLTSGTFSAASGSADDELATTNPEGTAWVLRSGGIASLLAVYLATRIRDDDDDDASKGAYRPLNSDPEPPSPESTSESFDERRSSQESTSRSTNDEASG